MTECETYKQQIKKAKETVCKLEDELHLVRRKIERNPTSAIYLQQFKEIMLDMTITLNELEHSQSAWENCLMNQGNRRTA